MDGVPAIATVVDVATITVPAASAVSVLFRDKAVLFPTRGRCCPSSLDKRRTRGTLRGETGPRVRATGGLPYPRHGLGGAQVYPAGHLRVGGCTRATFQCRCDVASEPAACAACQLG